MKEQPLTSTMMTEAPIRYDDVAKMQMQHRKITEPEVEAELEAPENKVHLGPTHNLVIGATLRIEYRVVGGWREVTHVSRRQTYELS